MGFDPERAGSWARVTVSEEDVPALDRGFARLLAEEMRPFIKPAMEESLREYMGPNGDKHKKDHQELDELREARVAGEKNRVADRRVIRNGVTIALIMLGINVIGLLFVYWVVTVKMVAH